MLELKAVLYYNHWGEIFVSIKYFEAPDVTKRVSEIVETLNFSHVPLQCIYCIRSVGSKSRYTIARIYGFRRIWQLVLNLPSAYTIEVISERYDKLPEDEKTKTLIHELLHIPKGFSGGFRPHKGYIDQRTVECLYKKMQTKKSKMIRVNG